jgi:hypothetical protein
LRARYCNLRGRSLTVSTSTKDVIKKQYANVPPHGLIRGLGGWADNEKA